MKTVFSLLIASALSAQVWNCATFGTQDGDAYNMVERQSRVAIKDPTATIKIGKAEVFTFTKFKSTVDGMSFYKVKGQEVYFSSTSNEDRQIFVLSQDEQIFVLDDCTETK